MPRPPAGEKQAGAEPAQAKASSAPCSHVVPVSFSLPSPLFFTSRSFLSPVRASVPGVATLLLKRGGSIIGSGPEGQRSSVLPRDSSAPESNAVPLVWKAVSVAPRSASSRSVQFLAIASSGLFQLQLPTSSPGKGGIPVLTIGKSRGGGSGPMREPFSLLASGVKVAASEQAREVCGSDRSDPSH
ncbi:hypothetical protein NDU88_000461 [Pleurodeles waltl]|uniref:Uncharacterized protein n=1 Tax=Pleurodeles waltl TaxID=8319 RepID=A0AAV7VW60_PLEWA|nr:hypothetical protein NDU88_000461 [Pleurodeles waltl]